VFARSPVQPPAKAGWRRRFPLVSAAIFVVLPLWILVQVCLTPTIEFFDFRYAYRPAAEAVVAGASPYPADLDALAGRDQFVYPPPVAFAFTPFLALGPHVGELVFFGVSAAAVVLAVWLLGVRDWRVMGVVLVWPPVLTGLALGTLSPFIALMVAAGWYFRKRALPSGLFFAASIISKLFVWPLLVWLVASRRPRHALGVVAIGLSITLVSWAAIGFAGMKSYPGLIERLAADEAGDSYTPYALFAALGAGDSVAHAAALVSGALVLAIAVQRARRGDDASAFVLALCSGMVLTPIAWLHYFVLLIVPLALRRPKLSPLWFFPLVLWVAPQTNSGGSPLLIALVLGLTAATIVGGPDTPTPRRWPTRLRARAFASSP
jgi:alpha-1,2-mannosyltransferase